MIAIFLSLGTKKLLESEAPGSPSHRYFSFLFRVTLSGILLSVLTFFLWLPFRVIYNAEIKSALFYDSGVILDFSFFSATEVFIVIFAMVYLVVLFSEIIDPRRDFTGFASTVGAAIAAIFGIILSNPEIVPQLFGFGENGRLLAVLWASLMALVVWYFMVRLTTK